jgi:hypothetical protein
MNADRKAAGRSRHPGREDPTALGDRYWDNEPQAGWREYQAARQRVADLMWIDSQLHEVVRSVCRDRGERVPTSSDCQLDDATD